MLIHQMHHVRKAYGRLEVVLGGKGASGAKNQQRRDRLRAMISTSQSGIKLKLACKLMFNWNIQADVHWSETRKEDLLEIVSTMYFWYLNVCQIASGVT